MSYVDMLYPLIGFLVLSLFGGLGLLIFSWLQKGKADEADLEGTEAEKEYHCPHCTHDISKGVNALVKRFAYGGVKKLVMCPKCDAKIIIDLNMVETEILLKEPGRTPEQIAAREAKDAEMIAAAGASAAGINDPGDSNRN